MIAQAAKELPPSSSPFSLDDDEEVLLAEEAKGHLAVVFD